MIALHAPVIALSAFLAQAAMDPSSELPKSSSDAQPIPLRVERSLDMLDCGESALFARDVNKRLGTARLEPEGLVSGVEIRIRMVQSEGFRIAVVTVPGTDRPEEVVSDPGYSCRGLNGRVVDHLEKLVHALEVVVVPPRRVGLSLGAGLVVAPLSGPSFSLNAGLDVPIGNQFSLQLAGTWTGGASRALSPGTVDLKLRWLDISACYSPKPDGLRIDLCARAASGRLGIAAAGFGGDDIELSRQYWAAGTGVGIEGSVTDRLSWFVRLDGWLLLRAHTHTVPTAGEAYSSPLLFGAALAGLRFGLF